MVNMLHCKMHVNDGFGVLKVATSRLQTRNMETAKNSKMWNGKHCWTKMIRKHKNNSLSKWALVNKLFSIGYERWERFRRSVDGYYIS